MFDVHARRWVGISALFALISNTALAGDRPPRLCSGELSFVMTATVSSKPSNLRLLHGRPDGQAGLKDVHLIVNVWEAEQVMARPDLPQTHRQLLAGLTPDHFATGHVFTLTALGLSEWASVAEFEEWWALRQDLLDPRRVSIDESFYPLRPHAGFEARRRPVVKTLLGLLAGREGVPGVPDELLLDLRESYVVAVGAADAVNDERTLADERARRRVPELEASRKERAFEILYEEFLRRDRVKADRKPIKLPFSLVEDGKLVIDDASALHVLHAIVRFGLVTRLRSVDPTQPALAENQRLTGAVFPELVPLLASAPQTLGDHNMVRWIDPDDRLRKSYGWNVGPANPFTFGDAFTTTIGADLTRLGFDQGFFVNLAFQRREVQDSEPGPLEAILQIDLRRVRQDEAEGVALSESETRSIERAITRVLTEFRAFRDFAGVRIRPDRRPGKRDQYRLEIPGGDLETTVHLFEIVSEFNRFENRR